MSNKTRLLAGVALGCVLTTPAAFAEEYRGFYFGLWGGGGSADAPSKNAFDGQFDDDWVQGILDDIVQTANSDPDATGVLSLDVADRDPSSLDDSTDVWGALVGYRANKWFGAEIGYVHLGEVKYDADGLLDYQFVPFDPTEPVENDAIDYTTAYRFTSAGPTAAAVGFVPLGERFELHGKVGIFLADTRQTVHLRDVEFAENFYHSRVDASQTEFFAGIGATWNATESLAVRVEYQKFLDVGDDEKTYEQDIDVINIGVLFK
jgi:opacity protein-like surface antigen